MLRLSAMTLGGLFVLLLAFGGELTKEEQAELDALRSNRTSIVALVSDAFSPPKSENPTFIATLDQIKPSAEAAVDSFNAQLASYSPQNDSHAPSFASITTFADHTKISALAADTQSASNATIAEPMVLRIVTGGRVNVRSGPSTANPVLGQIQRAEVVRVTSDPSADWVKIVVEGDGIEGFMSSRFLAALPE